MNKLFSAFDVEFPNLNKKQILLLAIQNWQQCRRSFADDDFMISQHELWVRTFPRLFDINILLLFVHQKPFDQQASHALPQIMYDATIFLE